MEDQPDDQMLSYPTDRVVGIAPDRETVDAAREALRASGIDDRQVEVLGSAAGADDPIEDGDHGVIATAIRTVRNTLGEEAPRLRALNEALDRGEFVVQVELPRHDGDLLEEDKRAVGNALDDAGVGQVAFYGRLAVEELQLGA